MGVAKGCKVEKVSGDMFHGWFWTFGCVDCIMAELISRGRRRGRRGRRDAILLSRTDKCAGNEVDLDGPLADRGWSVSRVNKEILMTMF